MSEQEKQIFRGCGQSESTDFMCDFDDFVDLSIIVSLAIVD